MLWLSILLGMGCPKDRTGLSNTSMVIENSREVETILLRVDEIERRIAQIEEVTRAKGQQEIMKMEGVEQVRMELANLRGDIETLQFHYLEVEQQVSSQQGDSSFRLNWLEERADALEEMLGLKTPAPSMPPESVQPNESLNPNEQPILEEDKQTNNDLEKEKPQEDTLVEEPAPKSEDELLKLAEKHLLKGREEAAEAVLKRIMKENPKTKKKSEILYRLAESAFNKSDYREAARRFQAVLDENSKSQWASWALLRQGECFDEMGQKDNAKLFYQDVVSEYPKSKAAKEAKEKLK
tara:strand:- start:5 stop:892 length:888 start_codon:yes stop_codon:yes gene_type:complete